MTEDDIEEQLRDFSYGLQSLSQNLHDGLHRSRHRGSGFNPEPAVPFEDDPDPRRINVEVSAEERELYVNQFVEERTMDVVEIGDVSASALFGRTSSKVERIALLRAGLAFASGKYHDRMTSIGVTDQIEKDITFPLMVQRNTYSEIAEKTLGFKEVRGGGGLMYTLELLPRASSLIFLISDFLDDVGYYREFFSELGNHTVVPVVLRDPIEADTPMMKGIASYKDIETGKQASVWMGKRGRQAFLLNAAKNRASLESLFSEFGYDALWLDGTKNDLEMLIEYCEEQEGS